MAKGILLLILTLVIMSGCGPSGKDNVDVVKRGPAQDEAEDRMIQQARQDAILELRGQYKDTARLVNIYLVKDTGDWQAIRDFLIAERDSIRRANPDMEDVVLVGINDEEKVKEIAGDASRIWDEAYRDYHVCALDNQTGVWQYCYGGVVAGPDGEMNWQFIEPLDSGVN